MNSIFPFLNGADTSAYFSLAATFVAIVFWRKFRR